MNNAHPNHDFQAKVTIRLDDRSSPAHDGANWETLAWVGASQLEVRSISWPGGLGVTEQEQ